MPVVTSTAPSYQVTKDFNLFRQYGRSMRPAVETLAYRWQFFKNYQYNRYKYYNRMNTIKSVIDKKYHRHIDDWDQEHCMILVEGANINGILSNMLKPPNVQPAYPLINRRP